MAVPSLPSSPLGAPPGYRGPRGSLLLELKKAPGLTVRDLTERLGLSLNAVRHHLKELESEGLVEYQRENRGVGAPVFAYRLSEPGEGLFPRRYEETLGRVLDHLERRLGRAAAVAVLEAEFAELADRVRELVAGSEPGGRLEVVARVMAEAGYMAVAEQTEFEGRLVQHNCAIRTVAERFPEVCAAETRLLTEVLGGPVRRQMHILEGCSACSYTVPLDGSETTEMSAASDPVAGSEETV
jgi:DeoR family suf operon transcriptional repressor